MEGWGKAQKCSFLLYGPPVTSKSSTIAAMANFLEYDVYDLELMVVKDNIDLKELLMSTSSKSIVVIEDIVCSLNITGQRNGKEMNEKHKTKVTSKGFNVLAINYQQIDSLDLFDTVQGLMEEVKMTTNNVA
ncbi:hypothetical protein NL676_006094 [Syzygium grande]|nr:hypothetical protein NL676_006094 [Syzygium grande]